MADQCGATTSDGTPCSRTPSDGDHCWQHDGHGERTRTKFCEVKAQKVVEQLRERPSYKHAAYEVGVKPKAVKRWREDRPDFAARCRQALAPHLAELIDKLMDGELTSHQRWYLEAVFGIGREDESGDEVQSDVGESDPTPDETIDEALAELAA